MSAQPDASPLLSWRPRFTIRSRLTLTYAGLVTGCGAVLIAVVWVFMRFVPSYAIVASTTADGSPATFGTRTPVPVATAEQPATVDTERVEALRATAPFSVTSEADFLQLLLLISVVALALLAVLSGIIGWIVAGRVLRPLKSINDAATLAAAGSLDHRIGLRGPKDEIRSLSDTFDGMLDSLARSFEAHRRFAANASHELRTPLATVQTMIDVALADPEADSAALRALAGRIRTVNSTNLQTVEALLDLADISEGRLTCEPVDLALVVAGAARAVAPEARRRNVQVLVSPSSAVPGHSVVLGDTVLLRQCIGNLMRNAVEHNHHGGRVEVRVSGQGDTIAVVVRNTGERVPDEIVETLLEPFVRGAGRTSGGDATRGRGLGLAIAASVADAHGGVVRLRANPAGGLLAELRLPAARPRGNHPRNARSDA